MIREKGRHFYLKIIIGKLKENINAKYWQFADEDAGNSNWSAALSFSLL